MNKFTDREMEVLKLICQQLTSEQIGKRLFISKRTVENVRARILFKTGARNTVGIVIYVFKNGIYTT